MRRPLGVLAIRYRRGCGIGIHFSGAVQGSRPLDEADRIGRIDARRIPGQLAASRNVLAGLDNAAETVAARRPWHGAKALQHVKAMNT